MGCGASKAGPCASVQVPCTGNNPSRLNSTTAKKWKACKPLPKTTKAAELRRQANEAKLKNSNGLNSSTSLRQSASNPTRSKFTTSLVSKKGTSSPRSPRPKVNRPSSATTAKPQKLHLPSNVPQSCSQQPQGKTLKTPTEARTASCQSVKSLESGGLSKTSKNNAPNTRSKAKITTVTRPASCQSVKSLKSSGMSKSSKDNVVNTANEASPRISQPSKRPHSSPSLKKGSSNTKDGTKPMTSEPSKRPTSSPTKGQKQQQTKSCQPERPSSSSSMKENLPIIKNNVTATQKCPQRTMRPKSGPSNDNNSAETKQMGRQRKNRPRSSPASKGNRIEANSEMIKRHISSHLSKDDMPKATNTVKRKSCQSLKSPVSRPDSSQFNPAEIVETCEIRQHAAQETKADPTDQPIVTEEIKKVVEDEDTPKREVVEDNFQSRSLESSASDEELDYFVAGILQSQRNLVQKETSAEKSPKVLNSQSATVSSPTAGTGFEQGASFLGTPKDPAIEDDGSGCQQESNTSTEGSNIGEVEIAANGSKITQSPSSPTVIKENEKAKETGSTSTTAGDVLTIFPKENAHIDSMELIGVSKPIQDGPSSTDVNTPVHFACADGKKSPGSFRSSPGATKSKEKINLAVERKSSKTSIDGKKSSRTPTASRSSAKISYLTAGDSVDGSSSSQTTCSTSRPCSSRSTTDTSMSLNHRKSGQRPLSAAKKSKASENNPHSSARSYSDPRVSDLTKSLTQSRKSFHGQMPAANAERSSFSSTVQSADKKGELTPTNIRGELKYDKVGKMSGSQEMSERSSSATLSKRSVSRSSSKSAGTISPTPSVVKKELDKSKSDHKIHQTPSEQKGMVKVQSSCYERAEKAKSNDKGRIDGHHSQKSLPTSSLLIKEDLEKRPKSGRSISMGSNASIVKLEERLSNPRNSSLKSSLNDKVISPSQKTRPRSAKNSGSARSLRQAPREFEVLGSSKTLQFSSPSYPEVRSRNSRSKTSLNKMEVLNSDNELKKETSLNPSSGKPRKCSPT